MRPLYWAILLAIGAVVVGLIFGVAGIFLLPILGIVGFIALMIWLAERRAHHKPPLE